MNNSNATKLEFRDGDMAWVLFTTILVVIMFPGLAFFYSGMTRSKNALQLIIMVFVVMAVVTIQWYLFGYSLAFSASSGNAFIGNFEHAFFMGVTDKNTFNAATDKIPALLFAIFQSMFAAITPAVALGSVAERARILPMILFSFLWTTLVYDVVAYWTWNPNGWSFRMGGLDFAGGTPVHIASGAASLAYCIIVGRRAGHPDEFKAHNLTNVVLGTALLWFGWLGFNGGCAFAANSRAVAVCAVTNLAAACGGVTWSLLDYIQQQKLSALGFCSGAVAGLVCVTPACGFVHIWAAIVLGVVGATACNCAMKCKTKMHFDDAVDVFAVHAVGGCVGNLLTGVLASKEVASVDGSVIDGGWIDGHWMQVAYQLADTASGFGYSFTVSFILLTVINKIPGLSLRADAETETSGMDLAELGELAYHWAQRRFSSVTPMTNHQQMSIVDSLSPPSSLSSPPPPLSLIRSEPPPTVFVQYSDVNGKCLTQMTRLVSQLRQKELQGEMKPEPNGSRIFFAQFVNGAYRSATA